MKIVIIAGARPNFVKVAPLFQEIRRHPQIVPVLIHTGQHYDAPMSDQFFSDLEIQPPDINLGVGSGSHGMQTAEVMQRLEPVLGSVNPELVLVVGDVNSTLASALTAVKLGIPVAHVEAGLRSFDRTMPEEINRLVTDAISDVLFLTEESAANNLLHEGIDREKLHLVGNVMIDALQRFKPRWERSSIFRRLGLDGRSPYAVVTLHRPSNVDDPDTLQNILTALQELSNHLPILFPVHPRVKPQLLRYGHVAWMEPWEDKWCLPQGVVCLEPLGYLDCIALMSRARLVLTDSGGIQEETTVLGVPCLTFRENTERPVTITHGTNRLIGADPGRIVREALWTLEHPPHPSGPPPFWDGRAAERIIGILLERLPPGSPQAMATTKSFAHHS
ncbi:MAG: UDP-N-acetylglucosamine 2-epimerase (non-hydrolyzing) [Nitrospirae bacterium]|nr:MAG: UDP-N-acetylglucosamine 2-epimerase (non-hydrolyzing) [Nitrospirota bacterium]